MAEPSILGALRDPQFRSDTLRNLVEALNGAQRSLTVGSLGAVGDMGNTLANLVRAGAGTAYHEATGRPIPQALEYRDPARDFGTSASLGNFAEQQGWLPPQTFSMPEQAGALLGPIVAMKAPDLAQSTLRGLVSALKSEPSRRMVEGYMGGMGMKPQAIVWHGSPHQFDAFDSSKIGTGEGAQAYGHGLYLAEAPTVAEGYKNRLTMDRGFNFGGKSGLTREQVQDLVNAREGAGFLDGVSRPSGVADQVIDSIVYGKNGELPRGYKEGSQRAELYKKLLNEIQHNDSGSLYKVDLPDPLIARMLDWDKPLSQQAPEVRGLLSGHDGSSLGSEIYNRYKAGDVPQLLPDRFSILDPQTGIYASSNATSVDEAIKLAGGDPQKVRIIKSPVPSQTRSQSLQGPAAEQLRSLGIPGIRYLDGGSRADGAGTSNFVVFPGEESALTILERNGKPVRK